MTKLTSNITIILFYFTISCLVTLLSSTDALALKSTELIVYTIDNPLLESVDNVEPSKKLTTAIAVVATLSKDNNLELGIARLQLAKQFAQAERLDQAFQELTQAKLIFTRLNKPVHLANAIYLNGLITALYHSHYEKAIGKFQKAIAVLTAIPSSTAINQDIFDDLIFRVTNRLASLYLFLHQSSLAYEQLLKADLLLKKLDSAIYRANLTRLFSQFYIEKGHTKQAEKYLIKNYQQALATKDPYTIIRSLTNISRFYRNNQRYLLAINYSKKAIEAVRLSDNKAYKALSYNNLAISFAAAGQDNLAIVHYLNSLNLLKGSTPGVNSALAMHNIGEAYSRIGQNDKAYDYLLKANKLFKQVEHQFYQLTNDIIIAEVLLKKQQYQPAIIYAKSGLAAAKTLEKQDEMLAAHRILEKIYLQLKQPSLEIIETKDISSILSQQNEDLNKQIAETIVNEQQVESVALEQSLSDLKQTLKIEQQLSKGLLTQKVTLTIAIVVILCCLIALWLYFKVKINSLIKQLSNFRYNQFTNLPIYREPEIESTPTHPLHQANYVVCFEIKSLAQTIQNLSINEVRVIQVTWFNDINKLISRDIYQFSDSIFITTLDTDQNSDVTSRANEILQAIITTIPQQFATIIPAHHIAMAVVNVSPLKYADISKSMNSTLEFSLAALSAAQYLNAQLNSSHWVYLSPKAENSSAMFSNTTRQQWLNSLNLNLININHNANKKINIPWLKLSDINEI